MDVVTIAQAAEITGLHANTIRSWIKTGRVPASKVQTNRGLAYMIPRDALEQASQQGDSESGSEPVVSAAMVGLSPNIESVVQRIVSPFMSELQSAYLQLGAAQERIRQLEEETQSLKALPAPKELDGKDETIAVLNARVEDLSQSLLTVQAQIQPRTSRFRWEWLSRLLTGSSQHVG